jgi:hypothetical protein
MESIDEIQAVIPPIDNHVGDERPSAEVPSNRSGAHVIPSRLVTEGLGPHLTPFGSGVMLALSALESPPPGDAMSAAPSPWFAVEALPFAYANLALRIAEMIQMKAGMVPAGGVASLEGLAPPQEISPTITAQA